MLGKKYDLTYVIGVVRERAIDSLQDRMFLTANGNDTGKVVRLQRLQRVEDVLPAALPHTHERLTAGVLADSELLVAITVWLLSVSSKKVSPAGAHVASHVLDNDCNRVRLRINCLKQLSVA